MSGNWCVQDFLSRTPKKKLYRTNTLIPQSKEVKEMPMDLPFSILICLSCCLALSAATLRSPCIFRSSVSIDETTWFVGEPLSTVTWPKGKTWLGWSLSPLAVLLTSGWSLKSKNNYIYNYDMNQTSKKIYFFITECNYGSMFERYEI